LIFYQFLWRTLHDCGEITKDLHSESFFQLICWYYRIFFLPSQEAHLHFIIVLIYFSVLLLYLCLSESCIWGLVAAGKLLRLGSRTFHNFTAFLLGERDSTDIQRYRERESLLAAAPTGRRVERRQGRPAENQSRRLPPRAQARIACNPGANPFLLAPLKGGYIRTKSK
jgi:hypothetical protein